MPGFLKTKVRSVGAIGILAALVAMTTPPTSATEPRPLADALAPGRPSCHARVFDAAELVAAHPARRVAAIALERSARDLAAERKWGAQEEFDGSAIVSATLRVRLRGDPVTRSARLACARGDDGSLVCESPACAERQSDGTVLLRMTGGLYVGGGTGDSANRHLPDGHVYRLAARAMSACR